MCGRCYSLVVLSLKDSCAGGLVSQCDFRWGPLGYKPSGRCVVSGAVSSQDLWDSSPSPIWYLAMYTFVLM